MNSLPLDLLAYCLGHVCISDIRSCWSVCKRFKDAITTKKHFWRNITERFLLERGVLKKYTHHVDPFCVIEKKGLSEQFLFLFRGPLWFNLSEDNVHICISLRRRFSRVLEFHILKNSNTIQSYSVYHSHIVKL